MTAIRSTQPPNQRQPGPDGQNPGFPQLCPLFCPEFCPACGAAFDGGCRHCGLTLANEKAVEPPCPTPDNTIQLPFAALAQAADPLAALTSWRLALPPGGLLRLTPGDNSPSHWIIPKRALMQLMERAGFRLVGRGWLRKTWLFRRY